MDKSEVKRKLLQQNTTSCEGDRQMKDSETVQEVPVLSYHVSGCVYPSTSPTHRGKSSSSNINAATSKTALQSVMDHMQDGGW